MSRTISMLDRTLWKIETFGSRAWVGTKPNGAPAQDSLRRWEAIV